MPPTDPPRCERRYFRLPLDQIAYVRFVVESYEGLAQVTSLPGRAEMEWVVPVPLTPVAESLARALALEAGLVPIERPEDWPE
jgi:hypothetical protein